MAKELVLEQSKELVLDTPPNFLYWVIVDKIVNPEEEVYVYGVTTMISAAGDLVIQNGDGQRVFGASAGFWFGLYIVDPATFKPVPQFFEEPKYD